MSVPSRTWAMASKSWRSIVPPVGLQGKGSTSTFVLGVMAAESFSGVILKCSASVVSMTTGTPPTMRMSSI